ncbi:MAG: hypothetical protein LQ349_001747 [Xanthoria aureola]|nr:MAG: hypothetical protein LQ349_001747 [Xanthoria aureola]
MHYGDEPPDRQVQRAKQEILRTTSTCLDNDYKKIPAYLQRLHESNPETISGNLITELKLVRGRFQRCFIMPGTAAYAGALRFIALDGTHIKNAFGGVLLTATMRDNDGGVLLITWAIVESENEE